MFFVFSFELIGGLHFFLVFFFALVFFMYFCFCFFSVFSLSLWRVFLRTTSPAYEYAYTSVGKLYQSSPSLSVISLGLDNQNFNARTCCFNIIVPRSHSWERMYNDLCYFIKHWLHKIEKGSSIVCLLVAFVCWANQATWIGRCLLNKQRRRIFPYKTFFPRTGCFSFPLTKFTF